MTLVLLDVVDRVATITLNDPGRRNCASTAMSEAMVEACDEARASADVVILTGAGPAFSAGGDIDALSRGDIDFDRVYRGFTALATLPIPVLAAVNGPAVGAGMNFALACDVIIAARSAFFDGGFLDIGIHPGGGHLWSLQRRIGLQGTAATVLFGERLSAEDAERVGLIWRAVEDAELLPTANRMARRVTGRSAELVRRTKASHRASAAMTHQRLAIDLEEVGQRWSVGRPAFAEGVAAMKARLARKNSTSTVEQ